MEQSTPDLLQEYENEIHLVPVSAWIRLANYIIDAFVFYIIMAGFGAIWGISLAARSADVNEIQETVNNSVVPLYLFSLLSVIAYYVIFEGASKGRTLGKLITGTIVVRNDGSTITFKDAVLRTLCRFIPFEPISFLFGGFWHDTITHTMVIKKPR